MEDGEEFDGDIKANVDIRTKSWLSLSKMSHFHARRCLLNDRRPLATVEADLRMMCNKFCENQ